VLQRQPTTVKGFTLIELVAVLVIVAIIAIFIVPRTPTQAAMTLSARVEQLAADIRYTQTLAMSNGQRYCITLTPSSPYSGYSMTTGASNCATTTAHPANFAQPIAMCSGATCVTAPALTNGYLQFDSLGQPYTAAATLLAADAVITVTDGGSSQTLTVTPITGRVTVP